MFQYLPYLVFLGAAVQLVGIFLYIKETLAGDTKPNRITWLMWAVAPLIATAAAIADGVTWAVIPVFMAGFGPLLILAASFVNRNSYWKLETFDYFCGACSVLALVFWWLTQEPNIAIIFAIASDGFAAIPTLIKSWKYPETETTHAYTAGLFSALTSFAAIKTWSFSSYAFPAYLVIVTISIIIVLYRRKIFKK